VPRELLAPRSMLLNFIHREAFTVQAMHLDCRTVLGPRVNVASLETLLRLLTYLGRDARADRRIRER
jgi:hypothetical protein